MIILLGTWIATGFILDVVQLGPFTIYTIYYIYPSQNHPQIREGKGTVPKDRYLPRA